MLKVSNTGKILAIDFGEKYTGLAICDEGRHLVFAKGLIKDYKSLEDLFAKVAQFCEEENIKLIIFGIPSEDIEQSRRFRKIGKKLEKYLKNIPLEFEDEDWSSFEANNILKGFDMKNLRNKYSEHEISAMIILERYLKKI
jgi:putative Holliday junction resolvase